MGNVEKRKQKKQGHLSLGKERSKRAGWIEVGVCERSGRQR